MKAFSASSFWENRGFREVPPLPHRLNAATGAGFAKMVCKILSPNSLEVKILRTKELELGSRFLRAPPPL